MTTEPNPLSVPATASPEKTGAPVIQAGGSQEIKPAPSPDSGNCALLLKPRHIERRPQLRIF